MRVLASATIIITMITASDEGELSMFKKLAMGLGIVIVIATIVALS